MTLRSTDMFSVPRPLGRTPNLHSVGFSGKAILRLVGVATLTLKTSLGDVTLVLPSRKQDQSQTFLGHGQFFSSYSLSGKLTLFYHLGNMLSTCLGV